MGDLAVLRCVVSDFESFSRSAEEAVAFVRHLQSLLRHIGSSDANMERVRFFLPEALYRILMTSTSRVSLDVT